MRKIIFALLLLPSLPLWSQQPTEYEQTMARMGLAANDRDASGESVITMDEPRLAYVNLSEMGRLPTSKWTEQECWLEFHGAGVYFKKRISIKGQGGFSIRYPKKNFSFELYEDDWSATTDLVIGQWVEQDAFHLKAFWTDYFRGIGEIGYKIFENVVADRRPFWERGGYMQESLARCFPDGFPCILYVNGEFYGVYAWQLKKHRKNMNQKKHTATHIHLDGNLNNETLFHGIIKWTDFDVRNPKGLLTANGAAYDGNRPNELMGRNSSGYSAYTTDEKEKEARERSVQVKEYILQLSKYCPELETLEKRMNLGALRRRFEEQFDLESLLDYYVFYEFQWNGDGSLKNWQWFTYDGVKWLVAPYDLDQTFGLGLYGVVRPAFLPQTDLTTGPFYWLFKYYQPEIRERYRTLRQSGALSEARVLPVMKDWYNRIGEEWYAREMQAWPESPCYCEAICSRNWEVCEDWSVYAEVDNFSLSRQYKAGDICRYEGRLWRATGMTKGTLPYIRNANVDSLERLLSWVGDRLAIMDEKYDYTTSTPQIQTGSTQYNNVEGIYSPSGIRLNAPTRGINIYRDRNGNSRKIFIR